MRNISERKALMGGAFEIEEAQNEGGQKEQEGKEEGKAGEEGGKRKGRGMISDAVIKNCGPL